jgi:hypothetical protein
MWFTVIVGSGKRLVVAFQIIFLLFFFLLGSMETLILMAPFNLESQMAPAVAFGRIRVDFGMMCPVVTQPALHTNTFVKLRMFQRLLVNQLVSRLVNPPLNRQVDPLLSRVDNLLLNRQ